MNQMAGRLVAELDSVKNRRELDELEEYVDGFKQQHEQTQTSAPPIQSSEQ